MNLTERQLIVEMEQFCFTYDGASSPSLLEITLAIPQGEFVLLTGKSGCGKTTFTRCVNGLIPTFFNGEIKGSCLIKGMNLKEHETGEYSSAVGSVFQDPRSQFFTVHVKTEIPFPGENLGLPRERLEEGCLKAVNDLQITHLWDRSIFHLSSGEKQKVATASVYAAGVQVFVLDEPSANLDEAGTQQLLDALKNLKQQGHTVIISEHKLHYLKEVVDRVIWMEDGKVKEDILGRDCFLRVPEWFLKNGLRQSDLYAISPSLPFNEFSRSEPQIQADSLSFYYDYKAPLWKHVSFQARGGDIIGVIGKNGVGKSTLLRVLMGLANPKQGKVYVNGKSASKRQRRHRSFYVMQDVDYQFFAPSVLKEMLLGGENTNREEDKAIHLLNYFGLGNYVYVHPSTLSGGQKQRLSIALAFMSRADFLFLDEPTSGLDGENMLLVRNAIHDLAKKGCCIFVITHDYEFASQTFSSLLLIQEDKTVRRITPDSYNPQDLYEFFQF